MNKTQKVFLGVMSTIVVVSLIAIPDNESVTQAPTTPIVQAEPESFEVTAEMIVDVTEAQGSIQPFCNGYVLLDDYDLALETFNTGYTEQSPSATAVFDEMLSRC